MGEDRQELDPSKSFAGKLANCPTAIKKLSEILWPALLDNLREIAAETRSRQRGGPVTVVSEWGQCSILASISETNDDDSQQKGCTATGNEAFYSSNEGNEAYNPTGKEAYQGGSYCMVSNEPLQTRDNNYNPTGYESHQGRAYAPSDNEASNSPSREEIDSEAYFGLVPDSRVRTDNGTRESGKALEVVIQLSLLDSPSITGEEHGHAPHQVTGQFKAEASPYPCGAILGDHTTSQCSPRCQVLHSPAGRDYKSRGLLPPPQLQTFQNYVDPFISGSERRELLGCSSKNESEEEEETPICLALFQKLSSNRDKLLYLETLPLQEASDPYSGALELIFFFLH